MTESFSDIKQILSGVQFKNLNPVFADIISDWEKIVGKKYSSKTFLKDIISKNGRNYIYINVKSSAILQELNFFKRNLLAKIKKKYLIEIHDIFFKLTSENRDNAISNKQTEVQEIYDIRPELSDLENIKLDDSELDKIKKSIEKQKTLSEMQKTRMLEVIIKDLKTQQWMKQKGFPICIKCGRIITKKIFGTENICYFCQNNE